MTRSLKAALFLALLVCLLRAVTHFGLAAVPAIDTRPVDGHIDDGVGYAIIFVIICYALYSLRRKN